MAEKDLNKLEDLLNRPFSRRKVLTGLLVGGSAGLLAKTVLAAEPPIDQPEQPEVITLEELLESSKLYETHFELGDMQTTSSNLGTFIEQTGGVINVPHRTQPSKRINIPRFVYTQFLLAKPINSFEGVDLPIDFRYEGRSCNYIYDEAANTYKLADEEPDLQPFENIDSFMELNNETNYMSEYTKKIAKFVRHVYDPEIARTCTGDGIISAVERFEHIGGITENYPGFFTNGGSFRVDHAISTLGSMSCIGGKAILQMEPNSILGFINSLRNNNISIPHTINKPLTVTDYFLEYFAKGTPQTSEGVPHIVIATSGNAGVELDIKQPIPQGLLVATSLDTNLNIDIGSGRIPDHLAQGRVFGFPELVESIDLYPEIKNGEIGFKAKKKLVSGTSFAASQLSVLVSAIEAAMIKAEENVSMSTLENTLNQISDIKVLEADGKKYEVKIINPDKLFERFNIIAQEAEEVPEQFDIHLPFIGAKNTQN